MPDQHFFSMSNPLVWVAFSALILVAAFVIKDWLSSKFAVQHAGSGLISLDELERRCRECSTVDKKVSKTKSDIWDSFVKKMESMKTEYRGELSSILTDMERHNDESVSHISEVIDLKLKQGEKQFQELDKKLESQSHCMAGIKSDVAVLTGKVDALTSALAAILDGEKLKGR